MSASEKREAMTTSPTSSPLVVALKKLKIERLSEVEFILFGFSMMLGNRNGSWNAGLTYGYYTLLFNLLWAGSGYVCLCLCMGEMSSALPFSGGIFGFVRAALGPFNGFLVACCEFVYCTTYIVVKVQALIKIPQSLGYVSESLSPVLICCVYGFCLCMSLIGGKPVFVLTSMMGFFTFTVLVIYMLGTIGQMNTDVVSYSHYAGPFTDMTWASAMGGRLAAGTQYSGIQYFPLLSEYMKEPREQVPRMMLITCMIFILFSVFVSLSAVSQEPGATVLATADLPLKYGFARIFSTDISSAKWINVPCLFGVIFGLFYCSGKQLFAITKSGLLPSFLDKTMPGVDTPYLCYSLAAIGGAGLNIFSFYYPQYLIQVRAMSIIATLYICVACLIAYMVFRRKFSTMSRSFVNPFGDLAAIYGIVNYLSSAIGLTGYSSIDPMFLAFFAGYLIVVTIFFWTYLVKNQKFSEEEKKMMFRAYLINANRQTRKTRLKNNKVAPISHASHPSGDSASKDTKAKKKETFSPTTSSVDPLVFSQTSKENISRPVENVGKEMQA